VAAASSISTARRFCLVDLSGLDYKFELSYISTTFVYVILSHRLASSNRKLQGSTTGSISGDALCESYPTVIEYILGRCHHLSPAHLTSPMDWPSYLGVLQALFFRHHPSSSVVDRMMQRNAQTTTNSALCCFPLFHAGASRVAPGAKYILKASPRSRTTDLLITNEML
jgi:hypothetical protein